MAREPRNYDALRTQHTLPLRDQDPTQTPQQSAEPEQAEPTRPAPDQVRSPGWTEYGDMASQQASATAYNNWLAQSHTARQQSALQTDAQIDQARAGQQRDQEREKIDPKLQRAQELAAAVETRRPSEQLEPAAHAIDNRQPDSSADQRRETPSKIEQTQAPDHNDARIQRAFQLAAAVETRNQERHDRNPEQSLDRD